MKRVDLSKLIFFALVAFTVLAIPFAAGMHAVLYKTALFEFMRSTYHDLELVWSERETVTGFKPRWYILPSRFAGEGVTVNEVPGGGQDLLLLTGFFDGRTGLRLIRRDGTVIARWPVSVTELFGGAAHLQREVATDWNIDLHGSLALPDGSVVFNFENVGTAKIDRCGKVIWRTNRVAHHSISPSESGGFWIPGRRYIRTPEDLDGAVSPFNLPYTEDNVMKVSDDGVVVREISMNQVLLDNQLYALLSLNGTSGMDPVPVLYGDGINREIFHLNDIEELPRAMAGAFPMFAAGDLMVSLRNRNLVLVMDPASLKVKWWHVGPWVRQHDPDFQPDGTITVFNNNRDDTRTGTIFGGSSIVEIDPGTNRHKVLYGASPAQPMYTTLRGKHQVLPGKRILIAEHEGGRFFEVDAGGRIIWAYINRYSADELLKIIEAQSYSADYFSVTDWSCAGARN